LASCRAFFVFLLYQENKTSKSPEALAKGDPCFTPSPATTPHPSLERRGIEPILPLSKGEIEGVAEVVKNNTKNDRVVPIVF